MRKVPIYLSNLFDTRLSAGAGSAIERHYSAAASHFSFWMARLRARR
jgi:hypothetical protein